MSETSGVPLGSFIKNRIYLALAMIRADRPVDVRQRVARKYIRGNGIEIGALHKPLPLPRKARVIYVDRMTASELKDHYPELGPVELAPVSVVSDGETLDALPDQSRDFVIGNHFIEHTEDPIRTLKNWLRVLRPGGIVYVSIPDSRLTFDHPRERTSIEHLVRDHREGPAVSRREHFLEWVEKVAKVEPARFEAEADRLERERASIHFHVWEPRGFIEFLSYCRATLRLPFKAECFQPNGDELIAILSRR